MSFDPVQVGQLISRPRPEVLEVMGPTVELLTAQAADRSAPGLIRGTMRPGVVVPLHAHADPETFVVLEGRLEVLAAAESGGQWVGVEAGQVFHVPPNARHALRAVGQTPAVALTITTQQMVGFFEVIGTPLDEAAPGPPSPEVLQRFLTAAAERGYWNGSPADNAAVGIELPVPD